ncbi:NAD(P)H dehydrogenase (quinone) [Cohaesibacter sp. ES.047]|uniref:SDR family oxidoreductase n=1 Tax=Cohaesibacter sp. ES.047 TaxID=1798205 RepID=UPI000BB81186|nr:SDR family oxidoreductase [Cohaesibacter sp. ES.047]SNY92662.1 NAD(P)H dehydrogenase (quinone) [Cohaesibacter sp. ES.047]
MIAVTGASGHLGRLVIEHLLKTTSPESIIALVRDPSKVADFADKGVIVRTADYDQPESYLEALKGVGKLLMISGSAVGQRIPQHTTVIEAAKANGIKLIAYTSILKADSSPILLAEEHKATEELIKASELAYTFLRNGWYSENYTENLAPVLAHGAVIGNAGDGRVATATRSDYAAAAAVVLAGGDEHAGKTYELCGDADFSMADYAAEVTKATGKQVVYADMAFDDYVQALVGAGVPEGFATVLADADKAIKGGWLNGASGSLSSLIGRPTTPISDSIKAAL